MRKVLKNIALPNVMLSLSKHDFGRSFLESCFDKLSMTLGFGASKAQLKQLVKRGAILFLFLFSSPSLASSELGDNPQFRATTLEGKSFDLAQLRGKVVIINFWAKWCMECRKEMPVLNEIYKKYHALGLEIIGVSIDRKKYRNEVLALSQNVSYPIALISDRVGSFEEPSEIPINYLIDKSGKIVAKIVPLEGVDEKEEIENLVKPLL